MTTDKLKAWFQASRPPFFIATLIPIVIGWIMAGDGKPVLFSLALVGAFFVHFATNIVNDYFDYLEGADSGDSVGGSRVIQEGKISPQELLRGIIFLYGAAFLIALGVIIKFSLYSILPLVAFAWASSFYYVAPPIRYGYHALGELFVGINMGPVMVVGTYWIFSGHPDWKPLLVSIPVGLMVASILYYQSLPDMETDRAVGKQTLALLLGKKGAYIGLILFWILIYLAILLLVVSHCLSAWSLLFLLTLPIFFKMLRLVRSTEDWQLLHGRGQYVRMLYFFSGLTIIAGLL